MAMDNLQDMLSSVLSDPDAMNRIRSLGKELGLTSEGTDNTSSKQQNNSESQNQPFDISALSGLISSSGKAPVQNNASSLGSNLSPETMNSIVKFLPLLSGINQEDETTALLYALRPFLSSDKRKRLDDASKILKVMRILPKLRSTGIF